VGLYSKKTAEQIRLLTLELETAQNSLERAQAEFEEALHNGGCGLREKDERVVKLRLEVKRLAKKLGKKVKGGKLSPALESAIKSTQGQKNELKKIQQSRFWTREQRKDMY